MNILLTNDDGVNASGLKAVYDGLSKNHSVFVCAPTRQMSAMSHSIHLFQELETVRIEDHVYAVEGSPVDCVKVGLFGVYKDIDFDLVFSGINDGPNMGDDVFYSGTVAAAREAVVNGIFAIAGSYDEWNNEKDFASAVRYISKLVDNLTPAMLKLAIFLNINFPDLKEFKGVKITHLGNRVYRDYVKFIEKSGKTFAVIGGDTPAFSENHGSDLDCVNAGFISITPLSNKVYDHGLIRKFKKFERLLRL